MRRSALSLLLLALPPLVGGAALAIERFPPPEFETGHELPKTTVPGPRIETYEYVDMGVLAGALVLACYLALVKRSRRAIVLLSIFSLAYFGFWRKGCVCVIGSIQNVSMALFNSGYAVPLTVAVFFLLPLGVTIFFGRTYCAAVCPHGAIQDLVVVHPVKVPLWLERALRPAAYLYLGGAVLLAATGNAFIICQYDPFVPLFRMSGSLNMLMLGACFLVVGLFVARPYCRFLCPYGVLLRLTAKVSKWHAKITPDDCINCRLCEESCPLNAIEGPTADLPTSERLGAKTRLGALILAVPVVIALGGWIGGRLPVATANPHLGLSVARPAASSSVSQRSADPSGPGGRSFSYGGAALGVWMGLVIVLALIRLTIRRRREEYQIDRGSCVVCARCFEYCPQEQARLGQIEGVRE